MTFKQDLAAVGAFTQAHYEGLSDSQRDELTKFNSDLNLLRKEWLGKHAKSIQEFAFARRSHYIKGEEIKAKIEEFKADLVKLNAETKHEASAKRIEEALILIESSLKDANNFKEGSDAEVDIKDLVAKVSDRLIDATGKAVTDKTKLSDQSSFLEEQIVSRKKLATEFDTKIKDINVEDISKELIKIHKELTIDTAKDLISMRDSIAAWNELVDSNKNELERIKAKAKKSAEEYNDEDFGPSARAVWDKEHGVEVNGAFLLADVPLKDREAECTKQIDALNTQIKELTAKKADSSKAGEATASDESTKVEAPASDAVKQNDEEVSKLKDKLANFEKLQTNLGNKVSEFDLKKIDTNKSFDDQLAAYLATLEAPKLNDVQKFHSEFLEAMKDAPSAAATKAEDIKLDVIEKLNTGARIEKRCFLAHINAYKSAYEKLPADLKKDDVLSQLDTVANGNESLKSAIKSHIDKSNNDRLLGLLLADSDSVSSALAVENKGALDKISSVDEFISEVTKDDTADAKKTAESYKELYSKVFSLKSDLGTMTDLVVKSNTAQSKLDSVKPTMLELFGLTLDLNPRYATAANTRMLLATLAIAGSAFIPGMAAAAVPYILATSMFTGYATTLRFIQQLTSAKETSLYAPYKYSKDVKEGAGWKQFFERALYQERDVQTPLSHTMIAGLTAAAMAPISSIGFMASSVASVLRSPLVLASVAGLGETIAEAKNSWSNSSLEVVPYKPSANDLTMIARNNNVQSVEENNLLEIFTENLDKYNCHNPDEIKASANASEAEVNAVKDLCELVKVIKSQKEQLTKSREDTKSGKFVIKLEDYNVIKSANDKVKGSKDLATLKNVSDIIGNLFPSSDKVTSKSSKVMSDRTLEKNSLNNELVQRGHTLASS